MSEHLRYIIKTDHFSRSWTWIKRVIISLIICTIILLLGEVYPEFGGRKYFVLIFALLFIFVLPKDDLAVDTRNLFYIKKSIFPLFTTVKKYDISTIKFIRGLGTYTKGFELYDLATFGNFYQTLNSVEITFKNGTAITFKVGIYKKELDGIVLRVKQLMT